MLSNLSVTDYMATKLITLTKETDVNEAIKKLMNYKITCAPVVDDHGQLIGMFSEKDCINAVIDAAYNQGMVGKVGDFMTTEIITIASEASVLDVAEKFRGKHVRSFPVFEDVDLVGMISRSDVLRAIVSLQ